MSGWLWPASSLMQIACMYCLVSMARRGRGEGTAVHTQWGHTQRLQGQAAPATLVGSRACCGPWRAGCGLLPPGAGSLHVLPGVYGAAGSWGGHSSAHSTVPTTSGSPQAAQATLMRFRACCGP